jgi:hypothetical protein
MDICSNAHFTIINQIMTLMDYFHRQEIAHFNRVGVKRGNGTERTGGTGMAEPEKRKRNRGWNAEKRVKRGKEGKTRKTNFETKLYLLTYLKMYLTTLAIHKIFVKIQWVDFQMGRVILTNYLNSHLNLQYSGHTAFKLVKRGCLLRLRRKIFHSIAPLYLKLRLR